jgi:hypothetical protein
MLEGNDRLSATMIPATVVIYFINASTDSYEYNCVRVHAVHMLGLDDQPSRLAAPMNASSPESAAFPWFS